MQIGFDSVWSSPTTLHLRVLVWVKPGYSAVKEFISIPLADIEGLAQALDIARADAAPDPRDDEQVALFGVEEVDQGS